MKQLVFSPRPHKEELVRALREGLGRDYKVRFFGFGSHKSIILSESSINAVQISYNNQNSIQIEGSFASPFMALMVWLDYLFGTGIYPIHTYHADWHQLETKISRFLEDQFMTK